MGGTRKVAASDVSTTLLRLEYPGLARRLQLLWWWGRSRRILMAVLQAVLFAAALAFAVLTCSRAYGQLVHSLGSLSRM
jgi:hypothetical protein